MLRIENVLDPVHKCPFRPLRTEHVVAGFELIRAFFQNGMPGELTQPLPDFPPGRVLHVAAPGQNPAAAEIDQQGLNPCLLLQNGGGPAGPVGRRTDPQDEGAAGDPVVEPGKRTGEDIVVLDECRPEIGLLEKGFASSDLGGDRLPETFKPDPKPPAFAAVIGSGRGKRSPQTGAQHLGRQAAAGVRRPAGRDQLHSAPAGWRFSWSPG